jgi:acyl-coenzyme A synthetase/AMP-(fatty) acid ligase
VAGDHIGSLRSCLESATVSGPAVLAGADLSGMCDALVGELQAFQGCRIALTSQQAEHVIVALAAAQVCGCQIVLHQAASVAEELLSGWNVSAVIDTCLRVTGTEQRSVQGEGFRILIETSGTTGEPKLTEHSVEALLGRVRHDSRGQGRPRWLLTYNPASFGGLQVALTALTTASELVTVSLPTIPALGEAALIHRPTHTSATPTFWRSFLMYLGTRASELDLRQITLGGEIADEAILGRLRTVFPKARVNHIYASTETGALFSVQDGRPGFPAAWLETGIDGVDLRVQNGVLQVRSPRAMKRYVNREMSAFTADGYWITGDSVEQVGDRVLFRGREDATLNVGGAKVRPEEVEALLLRLPEVLEAKVYGVPNALTGMVVGADIVLQPALEEAEARTSILTEARRNLQSYKVPRVLHFVDRIEVSATGKKERRP